MATRTEKIEEVSAAALEPARRAAEAEAAGASAIPRAACAA
jgi:hypothetical protein